MAILIIGLIVFLGAHTFRTIAPAGREAAIARLGESGYKGLFTITSLIGFVLIVWGFARTAGAPEFLYAPPFWLRHVTELLVLVALILAVASSLPPSHISKIARHPLLVGTLLWALAHLFVNGEVGTTVLFGAFLIWAIVDLFGQRGRAAVDKPAAPSWRNDILAVVVGAAVYGVLVWRAHQWLFGVSPIT